MYAWLGRRAALAIPQVDTAMGRREISFCSLVSFLLQWQSPQKRTATPIYRKKTDTRGIRAVGEKTSDSLGRKGAEAAIGANVQQTAAHNQQQIALGESKKEAYLWRRPAA